MVEPESSMYSTSRMVEPESSMYSTSRVVEPESSMYSTSRVVEPETSMYSTSRVVEQESSMYSSILLEMTLYGLIYESNIRDYPEILMIANLFHLVTLTNQHSYYLPSLENVNPSHKGKISIYHFRKGYSYWVNWLLAYSFFYQLR